MALTVNIDKAKAIAHTIRRDNREQAFVPFDAVIMKQIPGVSAVQAEAERQAIRAADAVRQASIDAATTLAEIQALIR